MKSNSQVLYIALQLHDAKAPITDRLRCYELHGGWLRTRLSLMTLQNASLFHDFLQHRKVCSSNLIKVVMMTANTERDSL